MTTIAQVINRIYRDYLTPPGEQPARFQVGAGGIDAVAATDTLPVSVAMLGPEEQDAIGVGTLIEGANAGELFLVEAVTGDPPTSLTVRREMYETTATAMAEDDYLLLAGDDHASRKTVFDAVADSITELYPELWAVDVWETSASDGPIEIPAEAGTVYQVEHQQGRRWLPVKGWSELRNFPYLSSGRGIQTNGYAGPLLVHFRKPPLRPSAESDELADLSVDESWVKVVIVSAVAQVVANKDIDQMTIDFITEALEAEGFEIGEGASVRNSLLEFRNYLVRPLHERLVLGEEDRVIYA